MKKRELLKRWGILFLSMMVMSGTFAGPSLAAYAEEAGSGGTGGVEVAAPEEPELEPEPEPEPEEPEPEPEPAPEEPEPEPAPEEPEPEPASGEDAPSDDGDSSSSAGSSTDHTGNDVSGDSENNGDNSSDVSGENAAEGGNTGQAQTEEAGYGDTDGGSAQAGSTETAAAAETTPAEGSTTAIPATGSTIGVTAAAAAATTGKTAVTEVKETDEPEGIKEAENYEGNNEDLIAQQHIVTDLPVVRKDFRFTTVDKVYAFSARGIDIYEEQDGDSRVVGTIAKNGLLYELENEDNGWIFVESGDVRGFAREEDLIRGEEAEEILDYLEKQASRISAMLPSGISKETYFFTAQDLIPYYENEAFAFRRITTNETVIDAEPALSKSMMWIMEDRGDSAREVGSLEMGDLVYVIEDAGDGWVFIESGDVRGFVHEYGLDRSGTAQARIDEEGESALPTAKEKVKPEDNNATYYTVTSVKEGAKYNEVREKILEKALSCVGNPYVWGGTSLTRGADCSGFVQTLYSMFGYKLPRVAAAQSRVGTQIPVSDAAPGDLIFFARNGYVYHVAMYAGDGITVEAYSSAYGIITKELSDRDAVWATRIIED